MTKWNCWEIKGCGREEGGSKVGEVGVCPVSVQTQLNGIHGGKNAGRACWVVAGTLCDGQPQGTFAQKYKNCSKCDFYMKVRSEENHNFKLSATLLSKLRNK